MQGMTMASPRPLKPQNTMACRNNAGVSALPGDHFKNTAVPLQMHNICSIRCQSAHAPQVGPLPLQAT